MSQQLLTNLVDEVLTPYYMGFGRNIDNIYTIHFNEMTSDNARRNVMSQKKLLTELRNVLKQRIF